MRRNRRYLRHIRSGEPVAVPQLEVRAGAGQPPVESRLPRHSNQRRDEHRCSRN